MVSLASDPEVRRSGYGGTDIAQILGLSRFGGRLDVYLEKIGASAPLVETAPMRWGKILEEPIAHEYALQTGRKVRRVNHTLRHPEHPILMAHLDRTAHKKGEPPRVLEAKTAGVFMASDFGEPGSDQVPDDYLVQVQHYLGVTGWEIADLAVLIGGQKFAIYEIPRDDELIGEMHEETLRFHADHVVPRNPPEIDGSETSSRYLAERFADLGERAEMTEEMKLLAFEYKGALALAKSAEQQKAELGNRLREALGNASIAEADGVKVTWSNVKSPARTDWDGLLKAAKVPPALVAEFTTRVAPSRRLTVSIKD